MDDKLNITYLTLGGHTELHKYRYLYFIIILTIYILIICFNSTIVCLICTHKRLHEPMYIFIAALLVNAILSTTAVYPKLLIDFLSEKQIISYSACFVQAFVYYSFSAAEFLLLSAMAYDRYVSICKPLKYPTIITIKTIRAILVVAWLFPTCELAWTVVIATKLKLCSFTLNGIYCGLYLIAKQSCEDTTVSKVWGLVLLVNFALLPIIFIVFTYTRILIICLKNSKNFKRKAVQTCLPHLLVLINLFLLTAFDVIKNRVGYIPKTVRFLLTLILIAYPLANPIIYGLKMKEIYKQLKRLFCKNGVK